MMLIVPPRPTRGSPGRRRAGSQDNRQAARMIAVVVAALVMGLAVNGTFRRAGPPGWLSPMVMFAIAVAVVVVAFVIGRLSREAREGNTDPPDDAADEDHDGMVLTEDGSGVPRRVAVVAVAVALAVAAIMIAATARKARAQSREERGGFAMVRGADTLVRERFIRRPDALQGEVDIKGGTRFSYFATYGPGESVQTLTMQVPTPGAAADAPPRTIVIRMQGDSVAVQTNAGLQHVPTRFGAIPFINNSMAVTEFFTRRARSAGGTADIPLWATTGGVTLSLHIAPIGPDSLLLAFPGQPHHFAVDATGRILGGAIPTANIRIVRLPPTAADGMRFTPPADVDFVKPDYSAPPGAPYTAEDVTVPGPNGITLGGTLTKPRGAGPFPAIVTISGSGPQDRDEFIPLAGGVRLFRQVADTLSRRGIAVLRLDDRGLGASGGDATTSTSADFADDTRAAVAWLRTRKDIDGSRIGLLGHSEGGMIAPMVAATDPQLRVIIVMAGPASKGREISKAQNRYVIDQMANLTPAQKDSLYALAVKQVDAAASSSPWIEYWMAYDPAAAARKVKAATLIVQGETDRQVPVSEAEKLAGLIRAGGNRDVTVRLFPNVDHLFLADPDGNFANYDKLPSNQVGADVLGAIADWAAIKLGKPAPRP